MSAESSDSRPPQSNSAPDGRDAVPHESVSRDGPSLGELPEPSERVREFLDKMGDRAHQPLSAMHGRELRAECVEEDREVREVELGDGVTEKVEEVTERRAVEWWRGVAAMLDWHVEYHESTLRLEYGRESDPTYRLLDIPLDNSWMAPYQEAERAKLKAVERRTCGFETCGECETRWCEEPDEHATEYVPGEFEEPIVLLTGRTAAGDGRPSVDHAREIAEAWTGPNGNDGVARSLRYVMGERLGLGSSDWVRWTQGEPHTGKRTADGYGGNTGYHHAHDIVILDGAAAAEEVTAETFRTVIESHVEKCAGAGVEAHDLDKPDWDKAPSSDECDCHGGCGECVGTVSVKHARDDIRESVASYAAAYLANESKDLLERSVEYLAWAATMWATGTQKGIKSDSANHAIEADRCEHAHAEGEHDHAHGETVRRKPCRCASAPGGSGCRRCDGRGYHVVCGECGSPWAVDQNRTLTAHRTADGGHATAADGGGVVPACDRAEAAVEEELRAAWPSVREAAVVGGPTAERECSHAEPDQCPLCATETESPDHTVPGDTPIPESACAASEVGHVSAGFVRPPSWRAKAVVRDGEEMAATGGSVDMRPLDLPSAPTRVVSMAADSLAEVVCQECAVTFRTVRGYAEHGCEHGEVFVAWLGRSEPPAEPSVLSRREFVEAVPDRLLVESAGRTEAEPDGSEVDTERVRRYAEGRPAVSVVEVMGRFGLPPGARDVVAEIVESPDMDAKN